MSGSASNGREIAAIYHSHPRWEAVPSAVDLKENHYGPVPRIIVSLLADPPDVRVWRLEAESYQEIPWALAVPWASGHPPDPTSPTRGEEKKRIPPPFVGEAWVGGQSLA